MAMRSVSIPDIKVPVSTKAKEKEEKKEIAQPTVSVMTYDKNKFIGNPTTGYYPKLCKMTAEEKFDFEMASGVKLSNGATLLRPIILSLGRVDIKKRDDGNFDINSSISPNTLTMSEKELLNTKWLSTGVIKQSSNGEYLLSYINKDGQRIVDRKPKDEAMQVLIDNRFYM